MSVSTNLESRIFFLWDTYYFTERGEGFTKLVNESFRVFFSQNVPKTLDCKIDANLHICFGFDEVAFDEPSLDLNKI